MIVGSPAQIPAHRPSTSIVSKVLSCLMPSADNPMSKVAKATMKAVTPMIRPQSRPMWVQILPFAEQSDSKGACCPRATAGLAATASPVSVLWPKCQSCDRIVEAIA